MKGPIDLGGWGKVMERERKRERAREIRSETGRSNVVEESHQHGAH